MSALFLAFFLLSSIAFATEDECVYVLYVKTGSVIKGGTDSRISATIGDKYGGEVKINDLEEWGLMGPSHDYYERGNLDIFGARGACLDGPICRLNVTSDGGGAHHGWFCDYIEVTAAGPHRPCSQTIFYVRQWLSMDVPPYLLYAVLDGCSEMVTGEYGSLVVGNPDEPGGFSHLVSPQVLGWK